MAGRVGRWVLIGLYTPYKHENSNAFYMKIRLDITFSMHLYQEHVDTI
jgi:hypothetical protein